MLHVSHVLGPTIDARLSALAGDDAGDNPESVQPIENAWGSSQQFFQAVGSSTVESPRLPSPGAGKHLSDATAAADLFRQYNAADKHAAGMVGVGDVHRLGRALCFKLQK